MTSYELAAVTAFNENRGRYNKVACEIVCNADFMVVQAKSFASIPVWMNAALCSIDGTHMDVPMNNEIMLEVPAFMTINNESVFCTCFDDWYPEVAKKFAKFSNMHILSITGAYFRGRKIKPNELLKDVLGGAHKDEVIYFVPKLPF